MRGNFGPAFKLCLKKQNFTLRQILNETNLVFDFRLLFIVFLQVTVFFVII